MANVDTPTPPDNLKLFRALCDSRATLWQLDEFDLHTAVDFLEAWARKRGIDTDLAQRIMHESFSAVIDWAEEARLLTGRPK